MTAIGLRLSWVGKHTLFHWSLGWLMRSIGGIPVNRLISTNFVDQIIETFGSYDELIFAIAPEGTRRKTDKWKSGFYYIALGAKVPIALGYVDYRRKKGGIGAFLNPTGNIDGDLDKIREFYSKITAKFPENVGDIEIIKKAEQN
jgi:1-acyl-sn-glycerol-3-phosphate acyltransferase